MRRTYCPNDCDYQRYYLHQAGGGFSDIKIFRGSPYQRGYGIGTIVKRFGIPLIQFLGKHLLSTGMSIGSDLLANRRPNVKKELIKGTKAAAKEGLTKLSSAIDQVGTGKKLYKKGRTSRKPKDIFS